MEEQIIFLLAPPLLLMFLVLAAKWASDGGESRFGAADLEHLLQLKRLGLLIQHFKSPDSDARTDYKAGLTWTSVASAKNADDRHEGEIERLVRIKRRQGPAPVATSPLSAGPSTHIKAAP